jgi:hypothetical protein
MGACFLSLCVSQLAVLYNVICLLGRKLFNVYEFQRLRSVE